MQDAEQNPGECKKDRENYNNQRRTTNEKKKNILYASTSSPWQETDGSTQT